jgi:hypothetical protein
MLPSRVGSKPYTQILHQSKKVLPGTNTLDYFVSLTVTKARVFPPDKSLQTSLIFVIV